MRLFRKAAIAVLAIASISVPQRASADTDANTIRVSTSGNDAAGCGSAAAPCRTLQYAVNIAANGDTILIGAGTYTFTTNQCGNTVNAVMCIPPNKSLTVRGSYDPNSWSGPNLSSTPTVIDGQKQYRGVAVVGNPPLRPTATIESVIIRNGVAAPLSGQISAFGGGMWVNLANVVLRNIAFQSNRAVGTTGNAEGGAGSGGGLAIQGIRGADNGSNTLENLTFDANEAIGGSGPARGGLALGGALFTYYANVTASGLNVINNKATASRSGGSGVDAGGAQRADALGGGIAFQEGTIATLSGSTVRNNVALGGAASAYGGHAFGGGVFAEFAQVTLVGNDIRSNTAQGATGSEGGIGGGGGIELETSGATLSRNTIIDNQATGGDGSKLAGAAGGGGIYLTRYTGNATIAMTNNVIANNDAHQGSGPTQGGGGGGVWVQGASVTMAHNTLAQNSVGSGMLGGAMILLGDGAPTPATVNLSYSIIADHNSGGAAIDVRNGSSLILNRGLWDNNNANTGGPGSASGSSSMLSGEVGFQAAGSPNFNYKLTGNSPAIDAATGSTTKDDIDGTTRPQGRAADIGADEFLSIANLKPRVQLPIILR